MLRNLPRQYRSDPWIIALTDAMQAVLEAQEAAAHSVTAQESLDTVDWNLAVEERLAGITPPSGATVESRRTALKAKWRSGGKLTMEQIQAVCDAWKDGEVVVSFPNGSIHLKFCGAFGVPEDLDALKAAMRLVVPAHLGIDYEFVFLLIRDIHETMTLTELETQTLSKFAF